MSFQVSALARWAHVNTLECARNGTDAQAQVRSPPKRCETGGSFYPIDIPVLIPEMSPEWNTRPGMSFHFFHSSLILGG